jgi:deazaflavin-dependent oxidoreductase (nitroreductase family)
MWRRTHVPVTGEYEPSTARWVRDQVELYESSGGTAGTTLHGTGQPVVLLTMRGAKTGKVRKVPLMRVEHDGVYAAVASVGGAPKHPVWYYNLLADPHLELRDGPVVRGATAREVHGEEKALWWERAVAAFPPYAQYQARTEREIPLLLLE